MKSITIDWGSYSAKIFHSKIDKKKHQHEFIEEIIFTNNNFSSISEQWSYQLDQISNYLKKNIDQQTKVILSTPNELLSFRKKSLPVSNIKKARAMIPFQMEDEVPFNIQDTYLNATIIPEKKTSNALCYFAKKDTFQSCLDLIVSKEIPLNTWLHPIDPLAVLSSDLPFLSENTSTCVLDIGHETTKAYFFKGKQFHSFQLSHFGGSRIDEMMENVYQLPAEQLLKFKHESSFIVPKELFQTTKLSDDQKFFAENMDSIFYSFIQEFKRWEMSYRVDSKEKISQVLITGGTTQIKNLDQYLSYYWERPVHHLGPILQSFGSLKISPQKLSTFGMGDLISNGHKSLTKLTNHLGKINLGRNIEPLPLYSLAFVGTRSAFLSLICLLLGSVYLLILANTESQLDKQLRIITQNPQADISSVEKNQIFNEPHIAVKKIESKIQKTKQDLKMLSALNATNALKTLEEIHNAVGGTPCTVHFYESNNDNTGRFEITECSNESITSIKNQLESKSASYKIKSNDPGKIEGVF